MAFPFGPLGFTLIALGAWRDSRDRRSATNPFDIKGMNGLPQGKGLGRGPLPMPTKAMALTANGRVNNVKTTTVGNIQQRAAIIGKMMVEGSMNPKIIEIARTIISRKCRSLDGGLRWCVDPKDAQGRPNNEREVHAIWSAVTNPNSPFAMRYTNDHPFVDTFSSAELMSRLHAEDCDGFAIYVGALLMVIGFPVRMRIVQDQGSPTWSHIYLMVDYAKGGGQWGPIDATEPKRGRGWQLEGADDVVKYGKPAKRTVAVLDVDVTLPFRFRAK